MRAEKASIDPALLSSEVGSFAIDSREVEEGGVFFALSQPDYRNNGFNGDFTDATVHVAGALEMGAVVAVVRSDRFREYEAELGKYRDRIILVDDVIAAFQQIAAAVYRNWGGKVIAVTGSAGKTSAKELTAHVIAASGKRVLKNIKNYNNGLGHPLTVLTLAKDPRYDVAVLEMGMSTPQHEIERLCAITPPDISIVLNVLPVHIEHLGSIERIAQAKAEIVVGMKDNGIAVLNADDERTAAMAELSKGSTITFGIDNPADVTAANLRSEGFGRTRFTILANGESHEVLFPLIGRHNVLNALAAAAAAVGIGVPIDQIAASLETAEPPQQRGEVLRFKQGFTVINDSYNSNPDALMSMVRTLCEGSGTGRKIVVAGEMLELGEFESEMHRRVGEEIAGSNVDMLIGVRGAAKEMVDAAISAGISRAEFAKDSDEAGEMLVTEIKAGDVVLVKGSRGVRTEKIIERLLENFEVEGKAAAG